MLSFPKDFFEGETRSDYYVRPIVKREWAAMLEVLAEVDRVCRKHGITYFADFGTMLGAVRHKGFIPWDDDLDIAMKREDYNKFIKIAPEEFNNFEEMEEYPDREDRLFFCHTLYTAKKEEKNQMIVTNGRRISFDKDFLYRYHGCPFVMGIDIFPLDYLPADNPEKNILLEILDALVCIIELRENWNPDGSAVSETVVQEAMRIGNLVGITEFSDKTASLKVQLARLFDQLSCAFSREESDYLDHFYWYSGKPRNKIQKEWYDNVKYIPFENIDIPVPTEYDKVLSHTYGDYMTPVIYADHGFKQKKILEDKNLFDGKDTIESLENLVKFYN